MQNVVLVIHLLLALLLIGAVLLQRSEGGALGIGGGGGNVMSGRGAATALQKATWGLAAAFIATSLTLAFMAIDAASDRGLGLGESRQEEGAGGAERTAPGGPPALDLEDLGIETRPAETPEAAENPVEALELDLDEPAAPAPAPEAEGEAPVLDDLPASVPELPDAN